MASVAGIPCLLFFNIVGFCTENVNEIVGRVTNEVVKTINNNVSDVTYITIERENGDGNCDRAIPSPNGQESCYVASYKSSTDNQDGIFSLLKGHGIEIFEDVGGHFNVISFCTRNNSAIPLISRSQLINRVESDKVYSTALIQKDVPVHMRFMMNYSSGVAKKNIYENSLMRRFLYPILLLLHGGFNYKQTGSNVIIYMIDTTVDEKESDITGRVLNLYGNRPICNAHGTNMAKLIAGKQNGFAKDSEIRAVNVVNCNGKTRLSEIISGIKSVVDVPGKRSIIYFGVSGERSEILNEIIEKISENGIIVVSAAGNDGERACKFSPGSSRASLNVGSTDRYGRLMPFGNTGDCVDILSLGESVVTEMGLGDERKISGSSISAALVAGNVAVILESSPNASRSTIWKDLKSNARRTKDGYILQGIPHPLKSGDHSSNTTSNDTSYHSNSRVGTIALLTIILVFVVAVSIICLVKTRNWISIYYTSRECSDESNNSNPII